MARHLSLATAIDKNRVVSGNAFIALLEIDVFDEDSLSVVETLYFAHNNEDISFNGNSYSKAKFAFQVKDTADGVPEATVSVTDPLQFLMARIEEYRGGVGFTVRILIVNSGNLSQPPEIEEVFHVMKATVKDRVAEFTLGARNPLAMRFPRRIQMRDRCSWIYKSRECGYTGAMPSCDYSLQGDNGCAAHDNERRFGGFPGIRPR